MSTTRVASADFWPLYRAYLDSDDWRRRRALVLARDGWTCRVCSSRASVAHHVDYSRVGSERLSDLLALCAEHHRAVHPHLSVASLRG